MREVEEAEMWGWMQRNLSMDDMWSVLGYLLLMSLNATLSSSMSLPMTSLVASGMLTLMWVVNAPIRERTPRPNVRVACWLLVAVVSGLAGGV